MHSITAILIFYNKTRENIRRKIKKNEKIKDKTGS